MSEEQTPDGRQRLLEAALNHLVVKTEADLRVIDVAKEAGVAVGLIRHHFGSRDGLLTAAQQIRLEGAVGADLEAIRAFLGQAQTVDELLAGIRRITIALLDPDRSDVRLSRMAVIGTAHGRPELREDFTATVKMLIDALEGIILDAQKAGLVRTDLDPRATATFIQAYALGMVLHDLDPSASDPLPMVEVIMTAVRTLLEIPQSAEAAHSSG